MKEPISPLIRFWEKAYKDFQVTSGEGLVFNVPQFPDPLISAHFLTGNRERFLDENHPYFNEISSESVDIAIPGYALQRKFLLGRTIIASMDVDKKYSHVTMLLREALPKLKSLLADGFPGDVQFLLQLLPFLATLPVEFRTVFLFEGSQCVGVSTLGFADKICLVFNFIIPSSYRRKGYGKALVSSVLAKAGEFGADECIFWTEHEFLSCYADEIQFYRIYKNRAT